MAERTVRDSALSTSEKLVMLSLLSRAENEDCTLPARYTPTERQLAANVSVTLGRVKDILRHLRRHGWLDVRPGRGRPPLDKNKKTLSRRNSYILLPVAPSPCGPDCPRTSRKKGVPERQEKGVPEHPYTQEKGAPEHPVKGVSVPEFPQVNTTIALKGRDEGEVEGRGGSRWPPGSIGEWENRSTDTSPGRVA